jgi:hypothetical protein
MASIYYTSGQAALQVGIPRWRFLYLLETGKIPGPSVQVPGRRLFTAADIANIVQALEKRTDRISRAEEKHD